MDTDSLSFCKRDYSEFSENERQSLIDEINYMLPKHIIYTDDGYYKSIVIVATKNYILHEHGTDKIKFKGSSLTDQKKEPILLEMIKEIGNQLLIRDIDVSEIYNKYVKMTETVTDVRPWCAKKTVTKAVLAGGDVGARSQERKLYEVIRGIDASEGDKIYVYNTQYGMKEDTCKGEVKRIKIGKMELKTLGIEKLPKLSTCVHTDKAICYECNPDMYQVKMVPNYVLKLAENFDPNKPDTVRSKLLGRVFKTLEIFDSIVDKSSYPNYSLKTKQKLLADLT